MKRLLLAPLLLTLLFGCSKENPIVNLECTLDTVFSEILDAEWSLSKEDQQSGPILISFDKESFTWVTVSHKRRLGGPLGGFEIPFGDLDFTEFLTVNTTKDLIKFKHSYSDSEHIYEINRINGKIVYFSQTSGTKDTFISTYTGQCIVLEDAEPLF